MKVAIALLSFSSVFGALNAEDSAINHCTKANYAAINPEVEASPYYLSCASDIGVQPDQLKTMNTFTSAQADALVQSDNCKQLYAALQTAAAKQDCFELNFMRDITWSMATDLVKISTYPKVSVRCDFTELQSGFAPLLSSPNIMPCFSAAKLYFNIFTKSIPTAEQFETFRDTPECHALFDEAKSFFTNLPHCSFDDKGYDIRSVEVLSFDDFVSWAEFASNYFASQFPQHPAALAMAALAPSSDNKMAIIASSFGAGVMMTLVAMYVYTKSQRTAPQYGETTSLLHT